MKKLAVLIVVVVIGSFSSNAQIQKVDQEVFGMDCAPCAYGLERGLKKMEGLESVKVSLNDGKAYLELSKNNSLSLRQIQEVVKKNGFSAKKAEAIIKGKLVNENKNWKLQTESEIYKLTGDLVSKLKPGIAKVKGIIQDEEDDNLTNEWKLNIIQIYWPAKR
jgi:cation transport ATPase